MKLSYSFQLFRYFLSFIVATNSVTLLLSGSEPTTLSAIFYKRAGVHNSSEIMTLIKRIGLRRDDSRQVSSSPFVLYSLLKSEIEKERQRERDACFPDIFLMMATSVVPSIL